MSMSRQGVLVTVQVVRKGRNGKGTQRSGKTGKKATVYAVASDGTQRQLLVVFGETLAHLKTQLKKESAGLPVGFDLNKKGETFFPTR